MGHDNVNPFLLKLAHSHIVGLFIQASKKQPSKKKRNKQKQQQKDTLQSGFKSCLVLPSNSQSTILPSPHLFYRKKKAKVIPLPKTNDLSEPTNVCPVSILPLLSKPQKDIYELLLNFLNEHNLLFQSQSGFRPQQHQPNYVISGFLPSTTLRLLVRFFLTQKKLLVLLITIFYSRNYPYYRPNFQSVSLFFKILSGAKLTKCLC